MTDSAATVEANSLARLRRHRLLLQDLADDVAASRRAGTPARYLRPRDLPQTAVEAAVYARDRLLPALLCYEPDPSAALVALSADPDSDSALVVLAAEAMLACPCAAPRPRGKGRPAGQRLVHLSAQASPEALATLHSVCRRLRCHQWLALERGLRALAAATAGDDDSALDWLHGRRDEVLAAEYEPQPRPRA